MKKLIPLPVLTQMFSLSPEQVQAVMKSGGGNYALSKVTCLGQQPNGHFVYACEGENLPKHVSTFKIKLVIGDTWNADPARILDGGFVMYWA